MADAPDWIAADWGGTRLRAWAVGPDGTPTDARAIEAGAGRLTSREFEPALSALIEPWLAPGRTVPVVACGMVGSRQGWVEAPYAAVPCAPLGAGRLVTAPVSDGRFRVSVVAGLCQRDPPDVMRGEETQIAGLLAMKPGFEGVAVLPGTHAKWARVAAGRVLGFRSFMTGELFTLLAGASSLRFGLGDAGVWDDAAFADAAAEAAADPGRLPAALFGIRAASLVAGLAPAVARARLSGLLIGAEIGAARDLWQGSSVALIGSDTLAALYATALAGVGVTAHILAAEAATLAGLVEARRLTGDA